MTKGCDYVFARLGKDLELRLNEENSLTVVLVSWCFVERGTTLDDSSLWRKQASASTTIGSNRIPQRNKKKRTLQIRSKSQVSDLYLVSCGDRVLLTA